MAGFCQPLSIRLRYNEGCFAWKTKFTARMR